MKYLAAYALLTLGGKENPDAAAVKKLLETVSATVDEAKLNAAVNALKGKKLEDVISAGQKKLSTVSFGGASGASSAPAPSAAAKAPAKEEPKKEEPKKEEEEDYDMGDLFG
ncbi:hypothetical protein IMG5_192460 [Ichthyophthirius multifiliis]|uniref:60S acidic ribosomal protein P2 n=1 Tax=Ichthyophthirius multifiliis TaxID=5932 RepID=G0R4G7_ICHMU|nr:hypothetical protein IMG5_192460 [Ichthyophthirius multifiliis]EGR27642.1 hypothetical protein IMG5_192460 [Ichthyophthirius multifiliis]|eukprot:XP_004025094.1 hypothetical protein IMG5_192460 [Ichthyophthirius multifiliis]